MRQSPPLLPTAVRSFHLLHKLRVISRAGCALIARRVRLTMAVKAVVVVEAAAHPYRLGVGACRVAREMAKALHLRLQVAAQTVIGMTAVALILRDPAVFEMARGERAARGI